MSAKDGSDVMERNDLGKLIVHTAADIDGIPWIEHETVAGVRHKVLWQSGTAVIGMMTIDAGAENPEHTHHGAHHHILILSGECEMLGSRLGPGSYIYIPPGTPHAAVTTGSLPCTFFYTYRPVELPPVEPDEVVAV